MASAVGTTLLQSPGWNEGKARYETLGIHERKVISSSAGAALYGLPLGSAAPIGGSINISKPITQGLRPGLCRSIAPLGLFYVFPINIL